MKLERAQEIYSDYKEETLSPAMKLALEQHFEAESGAREDYDQFSQLFSMMSTATPEEVEVPNGFRASVMARVSQEASNRRKDTGILASLRDFFAQQRRREAFGILAAVLVVALAVAVRPVSHTLPPISPGAMGPNGPVAPPDPTTVIQGVDTEAASTVVNHNLRVHLPSNISSALVDVYVISATDQILDPAVRDRDATPVVKGQTLTNDESMVIPIGLAQPAPKGSTLNLLVEYTPAGSTVPGAQIVFTPLNPNDGITPSTAPPSNGNFFDSLQTIAAAYHTTIIADAASAPTTLVEPWSPGDDVDTALNTVASSAGYTVTTIGTGADSAYLLYHKPAPQPESPLSVL
jgi:hypothetical protein